jgi:hypothetical protein
MRFFFNPFWGSIAGMANPSRAVNAGKRIVLGANEVISFGFELIIE